MQGATRAASAKASSIIACALPASIVANGARSSIPIATAGTGHLPLLAARLPRLRLRPRGRLLEPPRSLEPSHVHVTHVDHRAELRMRQLSHDQDWVALVSFTKWAPSRTMNPTSISARTANMFRCHRLS